MKVNVPAGRPIQLDARRSTSSKGGVYDISQLSAEDQKRILAIKGVTEARSTTPAKKEG